jgi:hypothetical protein
MQGHPDAYKWLPEESKNLLHSKGTLSIQLLSASKGTTNHWVLSE